MEFIDRLEDGLQLVSSPPIVVIMPSVDLAGVELQLGACDNTVVMASPLHSPEKVGVACCIYANRGAVSQYNVQMDEVICH